MVDAGEDLAPVGRVAAQHGRGGVREEATARSGHGGVLVPVRDDAPDQGRPAVRGQGPFHGPPGGNLHGVAGRPAHGLQHRHRAETFAGGLHAVDLEGEASLRVPAGGKGGSLVGFAGGITTKARLLRLEGHTLGDAPRIEEPRLF